MHCAPQDARMDRAWWFAALVGVIVTCATTAHAQAELLSITSFVPCIEIDLSARNPQTGQGQDGHLLNCTATSDADSTGTDTVTILDVRLLAGTSGGDGALEVQLTTVTSKDTPPTTSPSGTQCNINLDENGVPQPTDCALSSAPYSIVFTSSEYTYYYDLTVDDTFDIPYCHVLHYYSTASKGCDQIKYNSTTSEYNQYTQTCSARVERIPNCVTGGTGANVASAHCEMWMNLLATDNIEGIMTGFYANHSVFNISQFYQAYATEEASCQAVNDTQRCIRTEFSSDILRKPSPPMAPYASNGVKWNDFWSVDHASIFSSAAYTLHDLPIPSPLPLGLDQSAKFEDDTGDLQILNCVGKCQANQQNCYNTYDALEPDAVRANGTTLETEGFDIGMFALGPQCRVYNVAVTPRVAVTVTVNVTNLNTNVSTILTTSNVVPGESTSDPLHTLALAIVGVGSLNNVLGPPIGGSVLVCGGPLASTLQAGGMTYKAQVQTSLLDDPSQPPTQAPPPFFNMRTNMAPYEELFNAQYNPWSAVLEYADQTGDDAKAFYPSNRYMQYQYMCVNDTDSDGRNDAAVPEDTRVCTPNNYAFYWIAGANKQCIGRGCQQLGITDMYWGNGDGSRQVLSTQFAADTCTSDPFICVPGFASRIGAKFTGNHTITPPSFNGTISFDVGYMPVSGCMATAAFEIAREIGVPPTSYTSVQEADEWATIWQEFEYDPAGHNFPEGAGFGDTFYSLGATGHILHEYMPPGYDYNAPNYWLQQDGGTLRMYYKPSQTVSNPTLAAYTPQISIELVVYLVGKFVAFEDVVPSGQIIQTECTQSTNYTALSAQRVAVNNTGTFAAQYNLQVVCPPLSNIDTTTPSLNFPPNSTDLLAPGDVSAQQTIEYFVRENFDTDPSIPVEPCVLTLYAIADVSSTLDQQFVNCTHTFMDSNGTEPAPVPFFGPNSTGWSNPNCGCWDFPCYKRFRGGTFSSWCALLIAVPIFAGLIAATGALVMYIVNRVVFYQRLERSEGTVDSILLKSSHSLEATGVSTT